MADELLEQFDRLDHLQVDELVILSDGSIRKAFEDIEAAHPENCLAWLTMQGWLSGNQTKTS